MDNKNNLASCIILIVLTSTQTIESLQQTTLPVGQKNHVTPLQTKTNLNKTTTESYPVLDGVSKKITTSANKKNATVIEKSNENTTVTNYTKYDQENPNLHSITITTPLSMEQRTYQTPDTGTYTIRYAKKTSLSDGTKVKAGTMKTGQFRTNSDGIIEYGDLPPEGQLVEQQESTKSSEKSSPLFSLFPLKFKRYPKGQLLEEQKTTNSSEEQESTNSLEERSPLFPLNSKQYIAPASILSTSATGIQAAYTAMTKFKTMQQTTNFVDGILQSIGLLQTKEALVAKAEFLKTYKPSISLAEFTPSWKKFTTALTNLISAQAQDSTQLPNETPSIPKTQNQAGPAVQPTIIPQAIVPTDAITSFNSPLYTYDAQGNPVQPIPTIVEPHVYNKKGELVPASFVETTVPMDTKLSNYITGAKTTIAYHGNNQEKSATVVDAQGIATTTWEMDNQGYTRQVVKNKNGQATEIVEHPANTNGLGNFENKLINNFRRYDITNPDANFQDKNLLSSAEITDNHITYKLYNKDGSYDAYNLYLKNYYDDLTKTLYKKGDIEITTSDQRQRSAVHIKKDDSQNYKQAIDNVHAVIETFNNQVILNQ